mgnify:CR=1 FL=1
MSKKIFIIINKKDISHKIIDKYDEILSANPYLWHICSIKNIKSKILSEEISVEEIEECYNFANKIFLKNNFDSQKFDLIEFFRIYYWELFYEYNLINIFIKKNIKNKIFISNHSKTKPDSHLELLQPNILLKNFFKSNSYNFKFEENFGFEFNLKYFFKIFFKSILNKTSKNLLSLPEENFFDNLIIASDHDLNKILNLLKKKNLDKTNNIIFGIHKDKKKIIKFFQDKNASIIFFDMNLYLRSNVSLKIDNNTKEIQNSLKALLNTYNIKIDVSYFEKLTQDYDLALSANEIMKTFFKKNKVTEIFIVDFNGFLERSLEQINKFKNLKINLFPHGWLANPEAYRFNCGKYYYNGILEKQILSKFNENVLFRKINLKSEKKSLPKKINKILILITRARNRLATNFDTKQFENVWLSFLKFLKKNDPLEINFKFHPNHNYKNWLINFLKSKNFTNYDIKNGDVSKISSNYDLVIDFGFPGSATREVLLSGIPILIFTGLYKFDRGMNSYLIDKNYTIKTVDELCSKFQKCINNPENELKTLIIDNKKLLSLLN